ncbi:MAG: helix-turn-helix domain-containing protein [Defluviitaleaceae bacterium]|nr:helix-turn-helix domain-containing protein [Defluviitaleaceae bacterium]MCL2262882.1 helix-turn-helix domain-containing protein [Defluviitaleaceae bacterium]
MVNMGNRLKALRIEKNLSQAEVARRIGISKAMISAYELEQRCPSYEVLVKLAIFYNVSADYLLGIEKTAIKYDGLSEKEIRAVMNIIEVIRDKSNYFD